MSLVDSFATRLANPQSDLEFKVRVASEIRDSVELHQVTADYGAFVARLLPEMLTLLRTVPVSMLAASPEHRLRNCLLDILTRLQTNEVLRAVAPEILQLVMTVLQTDNEENGVLCMKILTNLHRAYKAVQPDQLQPFFDLVITIFKNVPDMVHELFDAPASSGSPLAAYAGSPPGGPATAGSTGTPGEGAAANLPMAQALSSFKVLAECPIIIVLLYSTHDKFIEHSLPVIVPYIIDTLRIEAQPQAKEHEQAASKGEIYTGVSPLIRNRAAYNDFILAQIKIMSFLAYALRTFSAALQSYHNLVPDFVVRLLKDCPAELYAARKELLVSMRHILSTDFRALFISKVDVLLEERVLIGSGLTAYEHLRPVAYSTMADLIHHVRHELSVLQIWRTVRVFCKNMQDNTLATSFQVMSAKLLLNFMERVMALPDKQEGRQIMVVILKAFVDRFEMLNRAFSGSKVTEVDVVGVVETEKDDKMEVDEVETVKEDPTLTDLLGQAPIHVHAEHPNHEIKDAKSIFKSLMNFLKTAMFGFKSCNPPPPVSFSVEQWSETARAFTYEDVELFRQLFREGVKGQRLFSSVKPFDKDIYDTGPMLPPLATKDEKDLLEALATVFIHIDPSTLNEILTAEMEFLYEQIFVNPALLHMVQMFLASGTTSANSMVMLLRFLKTKLAALGSGSGATASVLLRLFKLCFMALTWLPLPSDALKGGAGGAGAGAGGAKAPGPEVIILGHVEEIIVDSLKLSAKAEKPIYYFYLLRTLFRYIGGGRFDRLYDLVRPLPLLLETLNKRIEMTRDPAERDIYVELCLMVPVRLSLLLPHLSWLMRPLVLALNGSPELVSQGLRTLELCVDNLNTRFDPVVEPVLNDIMSALWKHLRPLPYNHQHSHTTLRILGKLGGRNRAFLTAPSDLETTAAMDQDAGVLLSFAGYGAELPVRITPGVTQALQVLENGSTLLHYREASFRFIVTVLRQFINTEPLDAAEPQVVRACVTAAQASDFKNAPPLPDGAGHGLEARNMANELVEKLLEAVFFATSIAECRAEARQLIVDLCEHFTLLEIGEFTIEKRRALRSFKLTEHEGVPYVDSRTILNAVTTALSHYNPDVRDAGLLALRTIYHSGKVLCGPDVETFRYPMFRAVFAKFIHTCFEEPYYRKAGACLGLKTLVIELGIHLPWLTARQVELARTLFFAIKDVSPDMPSTVKDNAAAIMLYVLENCNKELTAEELNQRPFFMLSSLLAYELESANPAVRTVAKEALGVLSRVVGHSQSTILSKVTNIFLSPIFHKPLRALPFPMQIGYIEAIAFTLALPDTFMRFNEKLVRLLEEALALLENATPEAMDTDYQTAQQQVDQQVACIQLLSLALTTSDHLANEQPAMRTKIISVFFKTLGSPLKRAVDAAHDALRAVLDKNAKLPKDLLQSGLRPILVNLSDHKRLSLSGLDGLARLLELLTYYFKVEIGKKLLDHLHAKAGPETMMLMSSGPLDDNKDIQLSVAILNVFHVLPAAAHTYIPDVVTSLVYIEKSLRRVQQSPFRLPVAKFLDKYPAEAFEYFRGNLGNPVYGRLFGDFLKSPETANLQAYARQHVDELVETQAGLESASEARAIAIYNLVFAVYRLQDPDWLADNAQLAYTLIDLVGELVSFTSHVTEVMPLYLEMLSATEKIQRVVVAQAVAAGDSAPVYALVAAIKAAGSNVSWTVLDYFFDKVVSSQDAEHRNRELTRALELAMDPATAPSAKTYIVKKVINPTLMMEIARHGDLLQLLAKPGQGGWLDHVHTMVWKPLAESTPGCTINQYQFALLEMSVLLVKSSPALLADIRKDVILFGWLFIKYEDLVSKLSAYVLVAYFMAAFDTPARMMSRFYRALIKSHQPEGRPLVNQALDALAPVLDARIDSKMWATWPRRILNEDGHNVAQVSNIYAFIGRHAGLFYEFREPFVPVIMSAMAKVSYTQNAELAVVLAELLATWEARAQQEGKPQVTSPQQREAVVTYLVRFICTLKTRAKDTPVGKRMLDTLDKLLGPWPEAEVRLDFFERSLVQSDMLTPPAVTAGINALEVVGISIRHKQQEWIRDHMDQLAQLLDKSVRCQLTDVHAVLAGVLDTVLSAIPPDMDSEELQAQPVYRVVLAGVQEHLGGSSPARCWVLLAAAAMKVRPDAIDALLPAAIKTFGRTCKEVIDGPAPGGPAAAAAAGAAIGAPGGPGGPKPVGGIGGAGGAAGAAGIGGAGLGNAGLGGSPPPQAAVPTVEDITAMLDLLAPRISYLGDQRRLFLLLIAQLIERLQDPVLSRHIVKMVRHWVFSREELFPTVKEKAAILNKMLAYDTPKDRELAQEYYQIIVDVFSDEHLLKTEMTARLEQPYLMGTTGWAAPGDVAIRNKLLTILSNSLDPNVLKRLLYVFVEQNWEPLAEHQWLNQALQLLYGSADLDRPLKLQEDVFRFAPISILKASLPLGNSDEAVEDAVEDAQTGADSAAAEQVTAVARASFASAANDTELVAFLDRRAAFLRAIDATPARDFVVPLRELQYLSKQLVHQVWQDVFPSLHLAVPAKDWQDLVHAIAALLSREWLTRQADMRPNVVQTIMAALAKCDHMPPQLVKYLSANYGAWYSGLEILESIQQAPRTDSPRVAEATLDALAEMYAALQENDMFYGLWRTRSKFIITNSALSYEQCGMYSRAMQMHETAQIKARSGVLPFGESEYGLWEDHWMLCAEKLQQWDILTELAKHEGFNDLLLECGWRIADWVSDKEPLEQSIKSLMDVPTPRLQVFETFLCLQGFAQKTESLQALSKRCDEGIQLALRKWHSLPRRITDAHIPLLHTFQQYVEFMEASQIYTSLGSTTAMNLQLKSEELKSVLQIWHERLPNPWDDINIWGDLVTWRQHVFGVINKVYQPLIGASQGPGSSATNSAAYRGHHEIAWIINRFAHVARKHNMPDVCVNLLAKIYTLPNIEIQEAFLKLREQAKCHYQNPNDVATGLEVISNTNLAYFGGSQKSEFFTLKGMSLARLGAEEPANDAFATAVQIDVHLPKAWAEWGRFNDRRFKEHPEEPMYGATALSCYLQAAGLYNNAKSRKLLSRILWLLSLDDASGTIGQAFANYRGEVPVWYWVTFIPQLLTSLAHREARYVRRILVSIAKSFPQALHFQLRTVREEYAVLQRQAAAAAARPAVGMAVNAAGNAAGGGPASGAASPAVDSNSPSPDEPKQPWEYAEEIAGIIKTAYPLLALSLESIVDQINHRFKSPNDEDAYRLIVALLNDGLQYMGRLTCPREDAKLPAATENSISRFEGVLPKHIQASFEADFVTDKPNLETYIRRLRKWRNRLEAKLDARPNKINLEALSPPLSEFHYQKFEEIEVPGQNQELKDSNMYFVKLGRFVANVDLVRGFGTCYRRLTIRGHDGSLHPFAVQYPAARHCRREERVTQLFKILNNVLSRRKESRSRHLQFTLPTAVPLNTHIRLVQDNAKYISMYRIYERFCRARGQSRDAPFDYTTQMLRAAFDKQPEGSKVDVPATKMEIFSGIQATLVPPTIMRDFFTSQYRSFEDFWLFRKQFAYQYAGVTFMTFMMSINNRYPHKFHTNLASGNIWAAEMLPVLPSGKTAPTFLNGEPVPFRFTPNIQTLLGRTTTEGLYAMAVMIIAKGLTEPEFDLNQYLPVFVRDELLSWYNQQQRTALQGNRVREMVTANVDAIVKRATSLAQSGQGNIPANQTIIDLISMAVNPRNLAMTDVLWMPYY